MNPSLGRIEALAKTLGAYAPVVMTHTNEWRVLACVADAHGFCRSATGPVEAEAYVALYDVLSIEVEQRLEAIAREQQRLKGERRTLRVVYNKIGERRGT